MQDGSGAMPLALVLFGEGATCPRLRHPADCSMSGVWGDPSVPSSRVLLESCSTIVLLQAS